MTSRLYLGLFDDCTIYYRNQFKFEKNNDNSLRSCIKKAIESIKENIVHYNSISDLNEDVIFYSLQEELVIKWCRVEKYYCIVLSIDGFCPYIWSKDCDVTLVDWNNLKFDYEQNDGDEMFYINGETANNVPDNNVNESPVVALIRALQ